MTDQTPTTPEPTEKSPVRPIPDMTATDSGVDPEMRSKGTGGIAPTTAADQHNKAPYRLSAKEWLDEKRNHPATD